MKISENKSFWLISSSRDHDDALLGSTLKKWQKEGAHILSIF